MRQALFAEMGDALDDVYEAGPIVGGKAPDGGRCREPRHLPARSGASASARCR